MQELKNRNLTRSLEEDSFIPPQDDSEEIKYNTKKNKS
jgi:hypothetical protein